MLRQCHGLNAMQRRPSAYNVGGRGHLLPSLARSKLPVSRRRSTACSSLPLQGAAVVATLNIGEHFQGVGSLMPGEIATVFSAVVALGSVALNLYGNLLSERKRAELQKEFMRERVAHEATAERQSLVARYRGPLLEAAVDLEQRLHHLATNTGEWAGGGAGAACEEEITYTLFTMAQFLGFIEVVRREGPRERSFLQLNNAQHADTLACLVEGFRFILAAVPDALQAWFDEGDERDHPGARRRTHQQLNQHHTQQHAQHNGVSHNRQTAQPHSAFRISRGAQRAIGSMMIITPVGASRHYTMSYGDFYARLRSDAYFASWFQPLYADMVALTTGERWAGHPPFPVHCWSRVLLLQHLLVDAMDLLDPLYVRVPENRRVRLAPIPYGPLPRYEEYRSKLVNLEAPDPLSSIDGGSGGTTMVVTTTPSSNGSVAAMPTAEGNKPLWAMPVMPAWPFGGPAIAAATELPVATAAAPGQPQQPLQQQQLQPLQQQQQAPVAQQPAPPLPPSATSGSATIASESSTVQGGSKHDNGVPHAGSTENGASSSNGSNGANGVHGVHTTSSSTTTQPSKATTRKAGNDKAGSSNKDKDDDNSNGGNGGGGNSGGRPNSSSSTSSNALAAAGAAAPALAPAAVANNVIVAIPAWASAAPARSARPADSMHSRHSTQQQQQQQWPSFTLPAAAAWQSATSSSGGAAMQQDSSSPAYAQGSGMWGAQHAQHGMHGTDSTAGISSTGIAADVLRTVPGNGNRVSSSMGFSYSAGAAPAFGSHAASWQHSSGTGRYEHTQHAAHAGSEHDNGHMHGEDEWENRPGGASSRHMWAAASSSPPWAPASSNTLGGLNMFASSGPAWVRPLHGAPADVAWMHADSAYTDVMHLHGEHSNYTRQQSPGYSFQNGAYYN